MAQPNPSPTYVVLPATFPKGMSVVVFITANFAEAQQEAIRQTAANNVQYVIFTSTHYVDVITEWPNAVINTVVHEIVPPEPAP